MQSRTRPVLARVGSALAALPAATPSINASSTRGDFVQRTRALLEKYGSLMNTLAIYNDPDDYRRAAWQAELAALEERLERIAVALEQLAGAFN